jgi:thiol-disulfide isomerase/thioredoxin
MGLTFLRTLLLLTVAAACSRGPTAPLPDGDAPLAALTQPTVDGTHVDLGRLAGKVVVVNFWSPSCGPCVHEMPGLQAVVDELRGRGLELVTVMGDGTAGQAKATAAQLGLHAPILVADQAIMARFHVVAYPWTVIFDRQGRPIEVLRGGRERADFRERFEAALSRSEPL